MKSTSVLCCALLLIAGLGGTCFAQYDPDGLFQFSTQWQQAANESNYNLNLNRDAIIDATDLLRLIEGWRTEIPTDTPSPKPTPTWTPDSGDSTITIPLPGGVTMEMVRMSAGSFMMGSSDSSTWSWCDSCEQPVHEITIGYDFYMGKFEVTQAQWQAVMGSNPASGYGVGPNYPVYRISWDVCQDFVTELNKLGQGTFRLPSEAEWEYACRAGTTTRFYFGDSDSCGVYCEDCATGVLPGNRSDYMWYCWNNGLYGTPQYGSKPVGGKLPNDFDLYDMYGNVYEWCEDDWHNGYANAPANGAPWIDSPRGLARVARGGYWDDGAQGCRSSDRNHYTPGFRSEAVGLRLVREVP